MNTDLPLSALALIVALVIAFAPDTPTVVRAPLIVALALGAVLAVMLGLARLLGRRR